MSFNFQLNYLSLSDVINEKKNNMGLLDKYISSIIELCKINKVKSLYAFGSVLTNRFRADSDIDMIVEIDSANPLEYADYYFNLKFALQDLLKRPVDLLEDKALRNEYLRREIDNSKQLIYASLR